jgi:hypothetical protein
MYAGHIQNSGWKSPKEDQNVDGMTLLLQHISKKHEYANWTKLALNIRYNAGEHSDGHFELLVSLHCRASRVFEALYYKPQGSAFDSR